MKFVLPFCFVPRCFFFLYLDYGVCLCKIGKGVDKRFIISSVSGASRGLGKVGNGYTVEGEA